MEICALCLTICDKFETIQEVMKDFLVVLLPKIDLAAIQKPVTCANCADILTKCFEFKAACIDSYDYIIPFIKNKDDVKVDLKHVYLSKNGNGIPEGQDVCGFCMGVVKHCSSIPLDFEGEDMLKKMIERCLPELDFSAIKKPVICEPCRESLGKCFHFVTSCSNVHEKIQERHETEDVKKEINGSLIDLIKPEKQFCDDSESAGAEIDYKSFMDVDEDDKKFDPDQLFSSKIVMASKDESEDAIEIPETFCGESKTQFSKGNVAKMEDKEALINEAFEIKTDDDDFDRFENVVLSQPETTNSLYRRQKCAMPKVETTVTDSCSPQAKYKCDSKRRSIVRKSPSEKKMYKCNSCPYQSNRESNLKCHSLVHKDPSEISMYKCNSCSYQAKTKGNLKSHLLVHKDPSEIAMYKCTSCSYQAKEKNSLKKHLLVHKDASEVETYKCNSCSYQTKYKSSISKHLLTHKDPSEIAMYKCNSCSYQAKEKSNLKAHSLVHKDPSEITMYKCNSCSYQTRYKSSINKHSLGHMVPSEVAAYKCNSCSYQAKEKRNLKSHLLVHKDPSEIEMFKCNVCSYQSKHKSCFNRHLLLYKNPSVATYKCNSCTFQTTEKRKLRSHLLNNLH